MRTYKQRTGPCQALHPITHESRATSDESRLHQPCCAACLWAATMRDGKRTLPICANTPGAPGEIVRIQPPDSCPNFRRKPDPVLRGTPPQSPDNSIRFIPLTQGKFAIVDAGDYEWLSGRRWHIVASGNTYAGRKEHGKTIYMHREIMKPPKGMLVDHIDGNGLNNRRANLRVCTNQQNMRNIRKKPGASSIYKGVYHDKRRDTWSAKICCGRKSTHIAVFATEIEAARAYDRKARELFGEFARLNFPQEVERGSVDALKRGPGPYLVSGISYLAAAGRRFWTLGFR